MIILLLHYSLDLWSPKRNTLNQFTVPKTDPGFWTLASHLLNHPTLPLLDKKADIVLEATLAVSTAAYIKAWIVNNWVTSCFCCHCVKSSHKSVVSHMHQIMEEMALATEPCEKSAQETDQLSNLLYSFLSVSMFLYNNKKSVLLKECFFSFFSWRLSTYPYSFQQHNFLSTVKGKQHLFSAE